MMANRGRRKDSQRIVTAHDKTKWPSGRALGCSITPRHNVASTRNLVCAPALGEGVTGVERGEKERVKQADRPDSVHRGRPRRDRHSSGPDITARLGATYPPALRAASTLAYLVLLRVEIARCTRPRGLRPRSRGANPARLVDSSLLL